MLFTIKAFKYWMIKNRLKYNNRFDFVYSTFPTIYLFFVSCGTNMGDHAIVKAEINFIKQCLGQHISIIEVKVSETEDAIDKLKDKMNPEDIIVFSGGGYLGDEYVEVYLPMMRMLKVFKNNKMLVFPQTIFFKSRNREKKFIRQCKKCKQITIFVREQESKAIFDANGLAVFLVPDIVLSEKVQEHENNGKILVCMRNDVERSLSPNVVSKIVNILQRQEEVIITDTVFTTLFDMKERFVKLEHMKKEFANASLVVTDRIHGMIFSYLSKTPCIAFSNYNHKVRSEYEWLRECNYIKYIDEYNEEQFQKMLDELITLKEYRDVELGDRFNILKGKIKEYYAKSL